MGTAAASLQPHQSHREAMRGEDALTIAAGRPRGVRVDHVTLAGAAAAAAGEWSIFTAKCAESTTY